MPDESGFRPVELSGRFSDPAGHVHAVVAADTIEVRSHVRAVAVVTGTPGLVQPDPPAPGFVQLVGKHPEVREVLDLLGKPEPALDWFDLYKIYEIVCVRSAEARDAARRR